MWISWKHVRGVAAAVFATSLALTASGADTKGEKAPPAANPQASAKAPAQAAPTAVIVRDAQSGQLRPATAQEIQLLAAELDRLFDRKASAERPTRLPNGSTAYSITGNFGSQTIVRRNADGTLETACFDEAGAAKRFMGLEPGPPAPATVKAEEK